MASVIFAFVYKYFFAALVTYVVGMFTKALAKQFGNDRAAKIQAAISAAMLWAEQEFGLGTGSEKWEEAWKKIKELLMAQGITLTSTETSTVETLMEAEVPKINAITYSALPEEVKQARTTRSTETTELVDKLKEKHATKPTDPPA